MHSAILRGVTVAAFLGQALGATTARAEAPAQGGIGAVVGNAPSTDGSKAVVNIRSTGDPVTVAEITNRIMVVTNYGSASGAAWKDICISPCSFKLDPGLHELMVYGDGIPSAIKKVDLTAGQRALLAKPGSAALQWGGVTLTVLGILSATTGLMFMFLFTETTEFHCEIDNSCPEQTVESGTHKLALPLLLGGVAGTGLGIGMISLGKTSLEEEHPRTAFRVPREAAATSFGITYRGNL